MTETIPQPREADGVPLAAAGAGLLVLAPLRFEANAVRRGLGQPTSRVVRTGMGAAKAAQRGAEASRLGSSGGIAVMGTAAGLADDVKSGDLIVATEVTDGERTVKLPGAEMIAGELRRGGVAPPAGTRGLSGH